MNQSWAGRGGVAPTSGTGAVPSTQGCPKIQVALSVDNMMSARGTRLGQPPRTRRFPHPDKGGVASLPEVHPARSVAQVRLPLQAF
jgi:hypothetical protein